MIDPHIFRAYDIRGKAHSQLSADACRKIGQAFGTVLRRKTDKPHPTVIVGRDARTHGPELQQALIDGLSSTGCRVEEIGPTPSPVGYFTICARKADGGVQVTASHNPKEDNGLKLCTANAEAYSGEGIQTLRRMIEKEDFETGKGSTITIDATKPYIEHVSALFANVGTDLLVSVDGGNGIGGPTNVEVLQRVGAGASELYTEPDGTFPNHPADPSKRSTLKELQADVLSEDAAAGFAFDGDGDRLGVVNEKGEILSADEILLLLAKDHLSRHPGVPIVFTVSNSGILETEIKKWGGKPVMCKVGHSFVEHAMHEAGSLLGGEQSGHFFCGEGYHPYDDALVAALRILAILKHEKKPLSELTAAFPRVYQADEMRPFCADDAKGKVIRTVSEYFAKSFPVLTLDGARIDFGDGAWAGIRQSNTSPCLSICLEARSPEKLAEIETLVLTHMKTYPEVDFTK
jgi:phosphomannomutase / phosphoglucomutase